MSTEDLRQAYEFGDLQSFLNMYYEGARVLCTTQDFYDLTTAYVRRAASHNVRHAEIFFDPQTHTERGIPFETIMEGITSGLRAARSNHGISALLILCFVRDKSAAAAMATLDQAQPFGDQIVAVGLDSAERGHPPAKFAEVFARARAEGFRTVAHAGEEGPPAYIREALDVLKVSRIDHGVRCEEDATLVAELTARRMPLTACPLSNVMLNVFPSLKEHNLKRLLARGVRVTINSDDPAYFGGYVNENFLAAQRALDLTQQDILQLARNSFEASFLPDRERRSFINELDAIAAADESPAS